MDLVGEVLIITLRNLLGVATYSKGFMGVLERYILRRDLFMGLVVAAVVLMVPGVMDNM
jgi:hypothetical protein